MSARAGDVCVGADVGGTWIRIAVWTGAARVPTIVIPANRDLRMLAADLVFDTPVIGQAARKAGHTVACTSDAHRLLAGGELTAVFPEGYKGIGKQFRDRYKLQRFGRGGFVKLCLRTRTPIVPVAVVGAEETNPMLARIEGAAKAFGIPYVPITPTFPLLGPLGLDEKFRMPTYRRTEEVVYLEFGVQGFDLRAADGGEYRHYDVGIEHLGFEVDDRGEVDDAYRRCVSAGAAIQPPPEEHYVEDEDYYGFFAFAPDGIRIEVFCWPTSPYREAEP